MKKTITSSVWAKFCSVLVAVTALASVTAAQAETTLERIQRTGEVRIGYANEAPFAYTLPDGTVTGESPEIVKAVFKKIGVQKVNGVLTEWGGLIPGLLAGRFDVIAAGMYVTAERAQQVLFTDPHYQLGDGLLVAKGNPKKIDSFADFVENRKLKLAIMSGSTSYADALKAGVSEEQILQVPTVIAQLQAVRTRRADAAVGTQLTMKSLAKKGNKRTQFAELTDAPVSGFGALAFRKDDQDLRDRVNAELKQWLGSEEHLKVVAPFGFDRSNLTDKTVEEIVSGQ